MNDAPESGSPAAAVALPPAAASAPLQTTGRSSLLPLLVSLLALLVAGWLGLKFLEQERRLASLDSAVQAQQLQADSEQARFSALQQQWQQTEALLQQELASASARLTAQNEQLLVLERELAATNRRLGANAASGLGNPQLLLAEAEAVLRLARERLLVARDTRSALRLFTAADALLRQANDSSALGVRELLAQELASLRALPEVDVQGLYLQVGALAARIEDFTVQSAATAFRIEQPAAAAPAASWYAGLSDTLARYFVVTRAETAVQPLLSAEQQYLLRRGIQLRLEQARLALLRGQPEIWRSALGEALSEVPRWLAEDESGSRARLQQELQQLRETPIELLIPPLDATLRALQQLQQAGGDTP
jgi:uroporphyrin-III C-methyltransferase